MKGNNYTSNYTYQKTTSYTGPAPLSGSSASSSSYAYRAEDRFGGSIASKPPSYQPPTNTTAADNTYTKTTVTTSNVGNLGGLGSGGVSASFSSSTVGVSSGTGVTDREGARSVARRILDTYDRDKNGVIDKEEGVPMIVDAYKSFNRVFSPSSSDIESYLKVISRNGDGRVTLQDLEDICSRYLTSRI